MQMVAEHAHGSLSPPPTAYPPQFYTHHHPYSNHLFHMTMARNAFVPGSMLQAILDEENPGLPMFRNLRNMIFDDCEIGDNMEMLFRFLHNTPAMEKLIMQHCKVCLKCLSLS
jgi:hypothetical protein